jgi:hypothetical protein
MGLFAQRGHQRVDYLIASALARNADHARGLFLELRQFFE